MRKQAGYVLLALLWLWSAALPVWAAEPAPLVSGLRYSQNAETLRLVVDADRPVQAAWKVDEAGVLAVSFAGRLAPAVPGSIDFQDEALGRLQVSAAAGRVELKLPLQDAAVQKVFSLQRPDRLVIDLAKGREVTVEQELQKGIVYRSWQKTGARGALSIYALDLDPQAARLQAVLANDRLPGLETVSSMARRQGAVAAVNGGYFEPDGEIIGLLKLGTELVSLSCLPRTAAGIYDDGTVRIGQPGDYTGTVKLPGGLLVAVSGINQERTADSLILYNHYYGASTGTNEFGAEYVLVKGKVAAVRRDQGDTPIPADGVVLSVHGKAAAAFAGVKEGDLLELKQTLGSPWDQAACILGAGPLLVHEGQVYVTTKPEQFGNDVAGGRAPRTALGRTRDGHILLVVVDGRQARSRGMTLVELAGFLHGLGAEEAMNLDGGGSSEMVVAGEVMNHPSDGRERPVGAGLVVVPRR